ncbi:MAG: TonB-dependent receptor [Bacteroidia bacterium]|nr:TonB-dependent receptor [Bacteroidia bacterium]
MILLLIPINLHSQTGTVRGTLTDENTGETIPFANIIVNETASGFTTDLDGAFSIDLEPGTYSLSTSYVGFADLMISDIVVKAGEIIRVDMQLTTETEMIQEVVITSTQLRNTENALMTIQRKSANLIDGISSQSFKRSGDGDAASAIKRVTGISVEGGKYVFVRGLGDRYTKSMLNGMDIPGLDPDRNTLQMDIFPTNLIDNIIVLKSFTPDLPGDFTGGVVDIYTTDFPSNRNMHLSIGGSANPDMHFNENFLSYEGGSTDWLGMDDGGRDLPISTDTKIPNPASKDPSLTVITERFNKNLAALQQRNNANFNIGFNTGDQINTNKLTLGYNLALNYKNETEHFENVEFNTYRKDDDGTDLYELEADKLQNGTLSKQNVLISGLAGFALKAKNHKLSLNIMKIQNGESSAGDFRSETIISNSNVLLRDNLEFTEKSISNYLLKGKHSFGGFDIDWRVSPTFSAIKDKDVRVTPLRLDEAEILSIEPSEGAQPRRIWRNLDERNLIGKVDITRKFKVSNGESKIKLGGSYVMKDRDYEILSYQMNVRDQESLNFSGDPDEYLLADKIWTPETDKGTYIVGNFEPANSFEATQTIMGIYAMNEFPVSEKLKAVYGVRFEMFEHKYTGQNNAGTIVYDNEKVNSSSDFLPSANFIYALKERTNLRASYSRTLARPSFKEASIAQIYDALSDRTFIGNIELDNTYINNFDLRFENFGLNSRMFALSGFYKTFTDPIEIVAFSGSAPDNLQPRNVGDGTVYGVELEFRTKLDFITSKFETIRMGGNVSFIQSEVEMDKSPGGEYESRVINARDGEIIKETRQMQGQAPYILNGYLNYIHPDRTWEANISYNVQGSSLAVVGIGINADIYNKPFHSLNFKITNKLGHDQKTSLSWGVNNILGSKRQKIYDSYRASEQLFELFEPGRTISFSLGYRFI